MEDKQNYIKNKQRNIPTCYMNVKDNCLMFHINLKCLKMLSKSCQRTSHFHSLKTILMLGMLVQIITLKYNLKYKSNSNVVKTLEK